MDIEKEFIRKKRAVWQELDDLLARNTRTFDENIRLGNLYRLTVEDLSLAQTSFPESPTEEYLNQLVRNCHMKFFRPGASRIRKFTAFFTDLFPKTVAGIIRPILVSLAVFLAGISVSYISVSHDPEKLQAFLSGPAYEKSMRDLELREKFGNFDNIPENSRSSLSTYVWLNNSLVSLYCFVFGVTLGLGTLFILVQNGLMLGGMMAVYAHNGWFKDFFSLIMVHGSIELTAIVISGGAGLNLAAALLFPGRMRRIDRLKKNASVALLVLAGVVCMLCIAGMLEGFVTPAKPRILIRAAIAAFNFLWMGLYFMRGFMLKKKDLEPVLS